ncbi:MULTISPECIES: pilus assembly protein [unclassified Acinetobacter]|uniref:pilus assembly protein n=1 Tax=unclassified Acinetobacter TaxID=196816 RepID=UPI00211E934A|nr:MULTISPECIES: pilus assembly protein [unclassified Acinetobacter]
MKTLNSRNVLSTAVSALMTMMVCSGVSQASDIEIYTTGFTPKPVVMFALDNSGSMSCCGRRRAFDLKDSMQAVLLGEGAGTSRIAPVRNVRAGLSTFESPPWYPIKSGTTELYKTTVHPATAEVDSDTSIKVPRRDAGYIASPAKLLDDRIIYPDGRKDLFPTNGDVIFKAGNDQPTKTASNVTIDSNNKKAYIRFQVDVPRGATINKAYLELRSNTDNGSNKLNIRVAKHNDLYAANPTITNLQTFTVAATAKALVSGVDNTYLNKIFTNGTSRRAITTTKNSYKNDNIASPMYVYSMDVKDEIEDLIKNNANWCGMGDIVLEVSRENNNYTFYTDNEDRVNPHLYVDWTLTDNSKRANNCMFTDTKRSAAQKITNLGASGVVGDMLSRQSMNLQIQRIITDTATPSAAMYAETIAYMLGNSTKPLSNTTVENTSIDYALSGLTSGTGSNIKYISPIENVANYVSNSSNPSYSRAYTAEQQCGQHGIYFLTDGDAEFSVRGANNTNDKLYASAMGWSSITCNSFDSCARNMAKGLLKTTGHTFNNRKVKIKTSTVGFDFSGTSLPNWAADGGGQYTAVSASGAGGAKTGVVSSINAFLDDVFDTEIPEVATGSPTLPQDALNPLRIQPYGYYASFTPKPQDPYRLWLGNMNKYHLYNGELYNSAKTLRLIKADGSLDTTANGLWTGGMLGQLPLGLATNESGDQYTKRTIYTNREISDTAPYPASASDELKKVNVTSLFGTGTSALFVNDPDKNYWLNLLGYNVGANETGVTLANLSAKPELRQLGAVMHSTPILLTQSGKITVDTNGINTTNRDDYLLFGTTQGLLHVVKAGKSSTDADRGKEVFTFVPHEMMEKQRTAFLTEDSTTGGSANLFYGIDAPWVAHTQYVAKSDGTLTVNLSGRTVKESDDADEIALKGLQWVYGGLRMGGRSYYSLDLSDIDDPSLKFHINPDAADNADGTINTNNALSYMGQSWSKPTIAYVNFGGVRKLVMFVGGGYDMGYENPTYNQSNGKGAGVYMFDAMDGSLLWWASSNASSSDNKGAEASTPKAELQYSVVSQINAIDRDSDGLVDHLYFGDLGGQAFRVDLNNGASAKSNFATRVQRLYNGHVNTGLSPRFYEMPSFSVHDGVNGAFGVLALSSGNRSSPLAGTTGTNASGVGSAEDAVFVIYDNDVARNDLYTTTSLNTGNVTLDNWSVAGVAQTNGTGASTAYNGGWKYAYSTTAGRYKGLNELYALDNMLYVNVFDRDGTGIGGGTCSGGVKGDSYVYQFCLPTGKCPENFYASGQTAPNSVKLGAGILGTGLGQGRTNANNTGLIVRRPTTLNCTTSPNLPECQEFTTTAKLRQLRWYETR